ncbi:hypothetical protein ACIPWE_24610 [Streptomyces sp. NPDC090073]|uniref:hypothetical protein n=1 Tax=Streptomyces sp. NPDC090073 TaxID=3365936 RepID=UPI00382386BA
MNLITGGGLDAALSGVDVVVDSTGHEAADGDAAVAYLCTATRNLPAAEIRAGVGHHVLLTIVGVDRVRGRPHAPITFEEWLANDRRSGRGNILSPQASRVAGEPNWCAPGGRMDAPFVVLAVDQAVERFPGARIAEDGAAARAARHPLGRGAGRPV